MKLLIKTLAVTGALSLFVTSTVAGTVLRVQTHQSATSPIGEVYKQWFADVEKMSGGAITFKPFFSSSIVKSTETFDAAAHGILDCDLTSAIYQTGKNPAFQFVGDIMGGYDTPYQAYGWFYNSGGKQRVQPLYHQYGMHLIGVMIPGQESLSSIRPLRSINDLKGWKFRSPPGMETKIFRKLGAKPIVMDFSEIFTALETKMIDGADASQLAINVSLGLYDVAKHATYPGFHSMTWQHLACNKSVYDSLSASEQALLNSATESLAFKMTLKFSDANATTAKNLIAKGVKMYNWSGKDRAEVRAVALATWPEFATSPEAKALVADHTAYLKKIGLLK